MRLLVFFDLPTKTKKERMLYSKFRKFLLNSGFVMIQYSVYGRICKGSESVKAHIKKLKKAVPPKGNVRAMQVTEKQFARMEILVGTRKEEEVLAGEQLLLL